MHPMMRRPSTIEASTTGGLALLGLTALLVDPVGHLMKDLAWFLLEVIGRIIDRPTSRVVLGYVVAVAGSLALEQRRGLLNGPWQIPWQLSCLLALLGMGYCIALAWMLQPLWILVGVAVVAPAAWFLRSDSSPKDLPRPLLPIVGLFVTIHVLVEGTAGHILTPWLGDLSVSLARMSVETSALYWFGVILAAAAPLLLILWGARRGLSPLSWLQPDLRQAVDSLSLLSLVALSVLALHYGTFVTHCPQTSESSEKKLLSHRGGIFDVQPSRDGRFLAVSRREAQTVDLIDLATLKRTVIGTSRPRDTLFDRTEPETLLDLTDGSFLLLAASSDSEQGNLLTRLDPTSGGLSRPLAARGISDLVGDGSDGVWISSEFDGRLAQLDLRSGDAPSPLRLPPGSETNKVVVDQQRQRAWSVGLWTDSLLRSIDLESGRQSRSVELGTHQWDMALSRRHDKLLIPRLVEGRIRVFDAETLEEGEPIPASFGVRPVETSPEGDYVVTGNLYSGEVLAHEVSSGELLFRTHIGGYIKGLRIGQDGRIFAGSVCGAWELTPEFGSQETASR